MQDTAKRFEHALERSQGDSVTFAELSSDVLEQLRSEIQQALLSHTPSSQVRQLADQTVAIAKANMVTQRQHEQEGTEPENLLTAY